MKTKKQIITAIVLSGSVGLGASSLFAQGAAGPSQPGSPVPQPRQTQPTIPGQPAPGVPQTDPMPGQPGTVPERMPGQPGTIPERVERPDASGKGMAAVSAEDIKKAKEALRAKGLNPGPIDGTLDAKTQQALRDFQKANKLPVTGVLDSQTAEKLGVRLEKGSVPQRGPGSSMPQDRPIPKN
jgi:hypothetical protein